MKRLRYRVAWFKAAGEWRFMRGDESLASGDVKVPLVRVAAAYCRQRLAEIGELAELTIRRKDNVIQDARTYGKDPRGIHG